MVRGILMVVLLLVGANAIPTGAEERDTTPLSKYEEEKERASVFEELRLRLEAVMAAVEGALAELQPDGARSSLQKKIVNGVLTAAYPSTVAVLRGDDAESAGSWCSGTLIGCSTVLTAQHCTRTRAGAEIGPDEFFVYVQNAGMFAVDRISRRPGYAFPKNDVALLHLTTPVEGIAATPLQAQTSPAGTNGEIVGFGRTGGMRSDYGLKRAGSVVTAACDGSLPSDLICWDFDSPLGSPGTDSNTCNGDSGGPLFVIDVDGVRRIAGVTSGGRNAQCLAGDNAYDADVAEHGDWIRGEAGNDLGTGPCGGRDLLTAAITASDAVLDAGTNSSLFPIAVPADTDRVIVAMNGVDSGSGTNDFDLAVRVGSPPTDSEADCRMSGSGQHAVCEVVQPSTDGVFARVTRKRGQGRFQLVTTTYPK